MKAKAVTILLLFAGIALAADEVVLPKDEAGRVAFVEVVQVEGQAKDALYGRALEWFARTFNSAQAVLQLQDKDNGKLVGKALFDVTIKDISRFPAGRVHYTLTVQVKDGRYRWEMADLYHDASGIKAAIGSGGDLALDKPACGKGILGAGGLTKRQWGQIKRQSQEHADALLANFKAFMAGQSVEADW